MLLLTSFEKPGRLKLDSRTDPRVQWLVSCTKWMLPDAVPQMRFSINSVSWITKGGAVVDGIQGCSS